MADRVRLTTTDNPYDPFSDWDEWLHYDITKGYCTCERIDRKAKISQSISDEINADETEEAMDELIEVGAIAKDGTIVGYKKVYNPSLRAYTM